MHGKGTSTWLDGSKYEGDWVENKQHGKGIHTFKSGNKFASTWENGKRVGEQDWIE